MTRTKYVGPYTIEDFGYGRRQVWRHGWRDGRGKYDRARNVVGGHNGGYKTGLPVQLKAARLDTLIETAAGALPQFPVALELPTIPRKPAASEIARRVAAVAAIAEYARELNIGREDIDDAEAAL